MPTFPQQVPRLRHFPVHKDAPEAEIGGAAPARSPMPRRSALKGAADRRKLTARTVLFLDSFWLPA